MRLTVVGSGTLVPDAQRHSAAHWVRTHRARVLLDCGAGTLHGLARDGVDWRALSHICVTHLHTDHTGDLAALLWAFKWGVGAERKEPLRLLGPPGFRRFVTALSNAFGEYVLDPGFEVVVEELDREGSWTDGALDLRTAPTAHTQRSIAYRVEAAEGAIGYTGDTGPSDRLGDFFGGCRIVVSECGVSEADPWEGHMTPSQVAALASECRPELLIVTHVLAGEDPEAVVRAIERGYGGRVVAGRDGLTVEVASTEVRVLRRSAEDATLPTA